MSSIKRIMAKGAIFVTMFLNLVLLLNANTTSCTVIHQPKAPDSLNRFKKII